jgi:hypothetical protein
MTNNFLNTSHQTLKWFVQQNKLGQLEMRPPFQRRPVWTQPQKSLLIDTILRGYPVPEIYVFTAPGSAGEDVANVVDGQQRLRACLEFMADKYAINFDLEKLQPLHDLTDTPWFGLKFSKLEEDERQRIEKYKLIVRDLEGVGDQELRHLFHRLNQSNMVLNAQELRFSIYEGGLLALVEKLAKRPEWNSMGIFTVAQRRRMLDSEFVSELATGYLHWPQNKKDSLDHYYSQYATVFPFADRVEERFDDVLAVLKEIFPDGRMHRTRWRRKSDFYTLFLALARGRIDSEEFGIEPLRLRLTEFSRQVDSAETVPEDSPAWVYRTAVQRAASDRSRRVRREEALLAFLEGHETMDEYEAGSSWDDDEGADEEDSDYDNEFDDDVEDGVESPPQ